MSRTSVDALAVALARVGAGLGVAAGLVELTLGPEIRSWVGDKQDTTRLGITTIVLSGVALASVSLRHRPVATHRLAAALGLLLPGLICFSTVGRLWLVPGPLLVVSGAMLLAAAAPSELRQSVVARDRQAVLVVVCGAFYVALGATALGVEGLLGVLGGLLVSVSMTVARRAPRSAVALLLIGAVPFAATTWWSVVTPLLALLMLTFGWIAISRADNHRPAAETGAVAGLEAEDDGQRFVDGAQFLRAQPSRGLAEPVRAHRGHLLDEDVRGLAIEHDARTK